MLNLRTIHGLLVFREEYNIDLLILMACHLRFNGRTIRLVREVFLVKDNIFQKILSEITQEK